MQHAFTNLRNIDILLFRGSKERSLKEPTGYKLERCLEEVPDSLVCKICKQLVKNPVECNSCKVLCCRRCLEFNFTRFFFTLKLFECSVCSHRVPLTVPSKTIQKKLKNISLKCKYDGCIEHGNIGKIKAHQQNCDFRAAVCQANGCSRRGLMKEFFKDSFQPIGQIQVLTCSKRCQKIAQFEGKILFEDKASVLSSYLTLLTKTTSNPN